MNQEQIQQVAGAIQQPQEQAEDTIRSLYYVFTELKNRTYSLDEVCQLILSAVKNPQSVDPDIRYVAGWLSLYPNK
jgi:hypothetical protein